MRQYFIQIWGLLLLVGLIFARASLAQAQDDVVERFFQEDDSGCAARILDLEILKKQAAVEGFALDVEAYDGGKTLMLRQVFVSSAAKLQNARAILNSHLATPVRETQTADLFGNSVVAFTLVRFLELPKGRLDALHDELWKALHLN